MSFVKPHAPGGWVKSASTTQLNKIGPQKTIPLYDTIILKEGYLTVRRYKGKNTVSRPFILKNITLCHNLAG